MYDILAFYARIRGGHNTPGMFGSLGPHRLTVLILTRCTAWASLPELWSAWLPQDVSPWSVHLPSARGGPAVPTLQETIVAKLVPYLPTIVVVTCRTLRFSVNAELYP
jgi:hypothetical protein